MTRHDPELIAALAEGTLDPEVAARLEQEIAADPQSAAELAAQRTARAALQMAAPPRLSDAERSSLHEAVAAAVNLDLQPGSAPAARPRRRVPWGPIAIAAASLAGLLVAVPLIGLLSVGGDDATLETVAFATTAAARDESTLPAAAPSLEEAAPEMAADAAENGEAGLSGEFAAETTTAAPETTVASTTTMAARTLIDGVVVLEEFLAGSDDVADLQGYDPDNEACATEAAALLDDADARSLRFAATPGDAVVWYIPDGAGEFLRILVFEPIDCLVIAERP